MKERRECVRDREGKCLSFSFFSWGTPRDKAFAVSSWLLAW